MPPKQPSGGTQNAVNGKCPKGFVHFFGPVCIEETTLAKIELPEKPELKVLTNFKCDTLIATLKELLQLIDQALEVPRNLIRVAKDLMEKPFDAAKDIVDSTLAVLDDINAMIDEILGGAGGLIDNVKNALENALSCPFLADTPLGKTIAAILDAIDNGLPFTDMISTFKSQMSALAKNHINRVRDVPLATLNDLDKLYQEMLRRSGVEELLKKAKDLEYCIRAACKLPEIGVGLYNAASNILEELGAKWDSASGKFTATLIKPVTAAQQRAAKLAEELAILRLAGSVPP